MKGERLFDVKRGEVERHFDSLAEEYDNWKGKNWYYYALLKGLFKEFVPSKKSVLELGCGTGEILSHLEPGYGVGVDISDRMIKAAKNKYSKLEFVTGGAESVKLKEKFDYIVMADLIDHLVDVQDALSNVRPMLKGDGRLIISTINPLWSPVLLIAENLGLKMPEGYHNFVLKDDICNILELEGYEVIETGYRILIPKYLPFVSNLVNNLAPRIRLVKELCLIQYIVASTKPATEGERRDMSLSIVIPCHNEAENIAECVSRIPQITSRQEVVIVNDGSTDETEMVILRLQEKNPKGIKVISYQKNQGKGHAVKKGFEAASGDVLMILDADMAIIPEDLPRFYQAIRNNKGDFINGTRMMYPMEDESMRLLNIVGNNIFSRTLSLIVGQRLTDTLCGTKGLLKKDFSRMRMGRDRWGDFDLLFGAAKLKLKIVEIPVHYQRRNKGETKMRPIKHGLLLFMMCVVGFFELRVSPFVDKILGRGAG